MPFLRIVLQHPWPQFQPAPPPFHTSFMAWYHFIPPYLLQSILNSIYSFHASVSAFAEYWNNTYGLVTSYQSTNITHRQVWHAFVQESLQIVADASDMELELNDALNIEEGRIQAAHQHSCSECTQPYHIASDVIDDASSEHSSNMNVDSNASPVKMVVLDGIVMGPTHCAYDDCVNEISNARGGALCAHHDTMLGSRCHVFDCQNQRVNPTEACDEHQPIWKKHSEKHSQQHLSGVRRMLRQPMENMAWQIQDHHDTGPHDQEAPENPQRPHYFSPA
ncbi:hypothetical protein BYT27DRAFT_7262814 [Phlegmacium glaucopus]|nr:hypothetical protein BYT27DRAFT_7262814 [Phlegmacium glaucopus]